MSSPDPGTHRQNRIYQASTGELYGYTGDSSKSTPFYRAVPGAKLYAYWITVNYRELDVYATVCFSTRRRGGETFVTRKITRGLARVDAGLDDCLYMGNLDSLRDWGHARDYVEMRILCCSRQPRIIIATGRQESVRRFIELTAQLG